MSFVMRVHQYVLTPKLAPRVFITRIKPPYVEHAVIQRQLSQSNGGGAHELRRRAPAPDPCVHVAQICSSATNDGGGGFQKSPRGLPVLGHLHLLGSLPHRGLRSIAASHGPVVLLRLGRAPTVVVSSASGAEEVMRARDLAFASRPASAMTDRLMYHLLSARRTLSFRRVREEQEAEKLVAQIRRRCCCSDSENNKPIDLVELLVGYANNVVSRAAFGDESSRGLYEDDDADRGRRVREVLNEFQKLLATQPVGEILPWLGCWVDAVTGLDRRVRRTFQALDALLDKAMEWAMAELVTHPRAMRRLQHEIRNANFTEEHEHNLEKENKHKLMPYLKCVIKETLRLHPPVPRETMEDTELLGYHIPARTRVVINAWAIGRDPATWGHDADEFVPETQAVSYEREREAGRELQQGRNGEEG